MSPIGLSKRPKDLIWFSFFAFHLLASVSIDLQGLLPSSVYPQPLKDLYAWYLVDQADPLLLNQHAPSYIWFKTFLYCEAVFQIPTFIFGMYLLHSRPTSKLINPLLLVYSTHSLTTILPCFSTILTSTIPSNEQKIKLMTGYLSITIPIIGMLVDSLGRVMNTSDKVEKAKKE